MDNVGRKRIWKFDPLQSDTDRKGASMFMSKLAHREKRVVSLQLPLAFSLPKWFFPTIIKI